MVFISMEGSSFSNHMFQFCCIQNAIINRYACECAEKPSISSYKTNTCVAAPAPDHTHRHTPLRAITSRRTPSAAFQSALVLVSERWSCLPPRWIAITNPFGPGDHQLALVPNPIPALPQAPSLCPASTSPPIANNNIISPCTRLHRVGLGSSSAR